MACDLLCFSLKKEQDVRRTKKEAPQPSSVLIKHNGVSSGECLMGTFLLAVALICPEITHSNRLQDKRRRLDKLNTKAEKMRCPPEEALRLGEKARYNATDKEGKYAF